MVTAFTAIDCLENHTEKTALWNVNTEKEYHEVKNHNAQDIEKKTN